MQDVTLKGQLEEATELNVTTASAWLIPKWVLLVPVINSCNDCFQTGDFDELKLKHFNLFSQ